MSSIGCIINQNRDFVGQAESYRPELSRDILLATQLCVLSALGPVKEWAVE
jgi:hypothetical protein